MKINIPIGYRLEWFAGDYSFYSFDRFQGETYWPSARVHSLHYEPVAGMPSEPVAYFGRFFCDKKHWEYNACLDPDAKPLYLGPLLHSPYEDATGLQMC